MGLYGAVGLEEVSGLRYQLVQATAASFIEADLRKVDRCVFLIHVFRSGATDEAKVVSNARDLDAFVDCLSDSRLAGVPDNAVVGPIAVPGYGLIPSNVPLYVGKAVAYL